MSDDLVEIARGSHGEVWYTEETMKEPRLLQHVLADEITRLRAELATARREGMEEAAKMVIDLQQETTWEDHHRQGPICTIRNRTAEEIAAAIRAAAGEVK